MHIYDSITPTCPDSIRASIAHPVFTLCDLFPSIFVYTCSHSNKQTSKNLMAHLQLF